MRTFITESVSKITNIFHYHVVDLLNGQAQAAGLKTCCEIRLQHRLKVNPLVKVIASDLWQVFWEIATGLQNSLCGDRRGVLCHFSVKYNEGPRDAWNLDQK